MKKMRRNLLPNLAAAICAVLVSPLAILGCSKMPNREISVPGATYRVPDSDVEAVIKDQGQTLVRIHPAGTHFKLILNTRSDRRQKETGKLVISGVSNRFGNFESVDTPAGEVICSDVPHWNCGFEIFDQNSRWSVVFDRDYIHHTDELKAKALSILESYRG